MVKSQLIEEVAARCGITATDSERFLNTLLRLIYQELKDDGEVLLSGFGKFRPYQYKSRIGVNPQSPKVKMHIMSRRIPKFTPGEEFKREVRKK